MLRTGRGRFRVGSQPSFRGLSRRPGAAAALTGASHSGGGPSALLLTLAALGGTLVLGAAGFAARQFARRRGSGLDGGQAG